MLEEFIDNFEKRVTDYPQSTPLCEEASDLGMTNYHDYIDTKFSLRAIYRFDQEDEILSGLLFLSTRQSIRQALIQYCLYR